MLNNNSDTSQEIREVLKLQGAINPIPRNVDDKIVPVINVNPKHARISRGFALLTSLSDATSATIYTCDTIKETYLTAASLQVAKDVNAPATTIELKVTDAETESSQAILKVFGLTLTALNDHAELNFDPPIKLKKGTNILITSDNAGATIKAKATLIGYTVGNSNA